MILRTVEAIKKEDSENVIETLDESRNMLRNSLEEFKREQEEYRKQLEHIMRDKEAGTPRLKGKQTFEVQNCEITHVSLGITLENSIPLSVLLRQKHDVNGLADLRSNSSMNPTYQAYFEALLVKDDNQQQHPTDKAAVVKYIRRRERRKRAEENKDAHQLTDDVIEKVVSDEHEKEKEKKKSDVL